MVICDSFFSFFCHFHLIWENWIKFCPSPLDFDEITPLLLSCSIKHATARLTDCRRLFFSADRSRARQKAGRPRLGWEAVIKKDLKEMAAYSEGVNGKL